MLFEDDCLEWLKKLVEKGYGSRRLVKIIEQGASTVGVVVLTLVQSAVEIWGGRWGVLNWISVVY